MRVNADIRQWLSDLL